MVNSQFATAFSRDCRDICTEVRCRYSRVSSEIARPCTTASSTNYELAVLRLRYPCASSSPSPFTSHHFALQQQSGMVCPPKRRPSFGVFLQRATSATGEVVGSKPYSRSFEFVAERADMAEGGAGSGKGVSGAGKMESRTTNRRRSLAPKALLSRKVSWDRSSLSYLPSAV